MLDLEKRMEKEALKRIKKLQKRFELNDMMQEFFENRQFLVIDFTADDNQETDEATLNLYQKIIKNFQSKYKVRIYYIFIENMNICNEKQKVLNILYVNEHEEEWENNSIDENNEILAYTYNITLDFSEFGYITLANKDGYIGRIR